MNLEMAAQAVAQAGALYAIGWFAGHQLMSLAAAHRGPEDVGLPERALAAVVGAVVFSALLMVAHIASRGLVFGTPWVVPLAGIAVVATGLRADVRPTSVPWARLAGAAVILVLVFVTPIVISGSGVRTGDSPWHLGWSQQLLSGEPTPTGPAPEFGRNAYPWGLHAVIATLVRLVPASNALVAHEALHILVLGAIPLAAACLARLIDRRAGWSAAGAAALIGGWGWISADGPAFVLSPSLARYGADLVVASPNSMYELFPPALPRELGLVLLGAAGVLIALASRSGDRRQAISAGVVVGLAGLVSIPMLLIALTWLCFGLGAVGSGPVSRRARHVALAGGAAFATVGIWLLPVVLSYVDLGGFVDITPELGVEWPLPSALWSWGLLLPLAAGGLVLCARVRSSRGSTVLLSLSAATAVLLGIAIARGRMEWNLGGNATLLHQGRMWPAAHLLGASLAGVALAAGIRWTARRSDVLAAYVFAVLAAVGMISPVLASTRLAEVMEANHKGFLYSRADFDDDGFVPRAAERLDADDILRVEGSDFLAFALFQFAGVKLAAYNDDRLTENDLRIRYAKLAQQWEERMADGGFAADFTALPASEAPADVEVRAQGQWRGEAWVLIDGDPTRT